MTHRYYAVLAMRPEIESFIVRLHPKDQKALHRYDADVELIERRMAPDAGVYALLSGMVKRGDARDIGVALLSSFGTHWAGGGVYLEWPWEQIHLISDAANYCATILLAGSNERIDFIFDVKRDSRTCFSEAVTNARQWHTPV